MRVIFSSFCVLFGLLAGGLYCEDKKDTAPDGKRPVKVEGSADGYRFGDLFFNKKTREIRFAAEVIQDEVQLEYALVHAITGKVHEALLATEVRPIDLQIVMKLLRYQESQRDIWPKYNDEGEVAEEMQDDGKGRVEFYITATDKAGKKTTFPLSDWVEKRDGEPGKKRRKMSAGSFAYTGSDLWEGAYIAESEGAFAAIYRYSGAMFNSFLTATDNDEVWFPMSGAVPEIGTKVEVTLKPMPDVKPTAGWQEPQPDKGDAPSGSDSSKSKQPT